MALINIVTWQFGYPAATDAFGECFDLNGTLARGSIITTDASPYSTRSFRVEDIGGAFAGAFAEIRTRARAALNWASGTRHAYIAWRAQTQGTSGTNPTIVAFTNASDPADAKLTVTYQQGTDTIRIEGSSNSSGLSVTTGQWYLIHVTFVVGGTCSMEIKTPGGSFGSSVTASAHSGTVNSVFVGGNGDTFEHDLRFGPVVLTDAALDYEPYVYRLAPDGNGSGTAWTNDWDEIEELASDGDTSFISTSSAAAKESVTLQSTTAASVVGSIKAVASLAMVRDEGGASSIETYIRPGSTDREGNENVDPGTTYAGIGKIWETNPDTSAAWSASEVDATEVGVLNNNAVAVRCTTLCLIVVTDGEESGTTFEESFAGTMASAGALDLVALKNFAGTLPSAGSLIKQANLNPSATLAPDGTVTEVNSKSFGGTLGLAGSLAAAKVIVVTLAGTLATAGALQKQANLNPAGTMDSSGGTGQQVNKALDGTLPTAGAAAFVKVIVASYGGTLPTAGTLALIKSLARTYGGTLGLAGTLQKQANLNPAGTLDSAGDVSQQPNLNLAGTLGTAGTFTALVVVTVSVGGTLPTAGTVQQQVNKALAGTLGLSGSHQMQVSVTYAGTLPAAGAGTFAQVFMVTLAGTLPTAGALIQQPNLARGGTLPTAGDVESLMAKGLAGTLGTAGALVQLVTRALAGTLGLAGTAAFLEVVDTDPDTGSPAYFELELDGATGFEVELDGLTGFEVEVG